MNQTFSQISVAVLLEGSRSSSSTASILFADGRYQFCYMYRSEANVLNRKNNAPHRGATELVVSRVPKLYLEGDYWTDRASAGRIKATEWSPLRFDTYDAAEAGTYK